MRVKYPIALSAAALAAGAAVFAPASSGQDAPETLTLELRHREARVAFVDLPPRMTKRRRSESPGDTAMSRGVLRNAEGGRAGRIHGAFVITGGRSPRTTEQVTATIVLPGGQIAVHGVTENTGGDRDVLAIVGGTGRYEGVRGSVDVTSGRRAVTFALRFTR